MSTARNFFKLNEELIDQVVFGMENQNTAMVLDSRRGLVIPREEADDFENDPERYIELPEWGPSEGFLLMEQFTAGLHNPQCRQQLHAALGSGRGVFRKFKEILGAFPPVKELWHTFKETRMRGRVIEWYNALADAAEMERYDENYEETEIDDLALSDFTIQEETPPDPEAMLAAERKSLGENLPGKEGLAQVLFRLRLGPEADNAAEIVAEGNTPYLAARAPDGQLAGFAFGRLVNAGGNLTALCSLLVVEEAWRGLGLGSELLQKFTSVCFERGASTLLLEVTGSGLDFCTQLEERGFSALSAVYRLDRPDPA